jgi:4'-phosphopantetheinyl transferase
MPFSLEARRGRRGILVRPVKPVMSVDRPPRHTETVWHPPPPGLALGDSEVHVWRASLERGAAALARLAGTLNPDERARADRFHFEQDRKHFLAGRGLLRTILAGYLGREPASLGFRYGPHGKPALAGPELLCFNLTHSRGLALLAVTWGRQVGVDVERVDRTVRHEEIAERFFSAREREALRSLPAELRAEAFFAGWTRKEAYLKAHGGGLSVPLDSFDVSLGPGEPALLLAIRDAPGEAGRWSLAALDPEPGYAAAVAVESHTWRLWCGRWPDEPAGQERLTPSDGS